MEIKGQQPVPDGSLTEQDDTETSTAQASSPTQETVAEQDNGAETESELEIAELSPEELQKQLAEQQCKTESYLDHLQRLQAEFDNYRRRVSQEQLRATSRGKENVLQALLPIFANFHLALQHADQNPNAVRQGVQMIWQQFEGFLHEQGVERIETAGQPFDPAKHEALSTAPATDETPANTIVSEIKAGYLVDGRMLCPAQVIVARAEEPSGPAQVEETSDTPDSET